MTSNFKNTKSSEGSEGVSSGIKPVSAAFANRYGIAIVDDGLDIILSDESNFVELIEVASILFSDENIRFWRALTMFRESTSDSGRRAHAAWMCNTFVVVESVHEVNLNSIQRSFLTGIRDQLVLYYKGEGEAPEVVPTLFDEAADQVKETIRESIYVEYKKKISARNSSVTALFQGHEYSNGSRPMGIYGLLDRAPEEIQYFLDCEEYLLSLRGGDGSQEDSLVDLEEDHEPVVYRDLL